MVRKCPLLAMHLYLSPNKCSIFVHLDGDSTIINHLCEEVLSYSEFEATSSTTLFPLRPVIFKSPVVFLDFDFLYLAN